VATLDPVSLFLSSITGNFLHEPMLAKRFLSAAIAASWLVVSTWALMQRKKDRPYLQEPDSSFRSFDRAANLERIRHY